MCKIIILVISLLKGEICQMAQQTYTLTQESQGTFKDRGSRFLAFAFPVSEQNQFEEKLASLKKEYYDARHHCYAFRFGIQGETSFANDDGEPSHTAGDPILGVLQSRDITNAAIIVVRYFGGTKLGVRGLIEAYRNAAADAIENNQIKAIIPKTIFRLDFTYPQTSEINRILHPFNTEQIQANYTDVCQIDFAINDEEFPPVQKALQMAGFSVKILEESNID